MAKRLTTNQLMARGAGGRFSGLSARGLRRKIACEVLEEKGLARNMQRLTDRMKDNAIYSLKGAAFALMQTERALIVKSPKPSKPGSAPHTKGKFKSLPKAIWYDVDKQRQEAFVGPRGSKISTIGQLMEQGGKRKGKRSPATYPARPFAAPALEMAKDRFLKDWKGSLS